MNKIPATVGILTFNNEATIERTLRSVQMFEDILINDGGSTDRTLDIAARYGARIIQQDARFKDADGRLRDYGGVRQQMLEAAQYDWFLYIDSDETISDGLREEIQGIVSKPVSQEDRLVYRVPIGIVLDGRQVKYSSNFPGYQHRFFNRQSGAHFVKPVHERIVFDPKRVRVGTLMHPWNTFTTREGSRHYLKDMAGYRALQVRMSLERPLKEVLYSYVYRSVRASLGAFIKAARNYMLHGFKDTAPLSTEIGRVVSPLLLAYDVVCARLVRRAVHLIRSKQASEPELRLLTKLLTHQSDGVFIDVGANAGAYVAEALKMYPGDKIYAFEPNPHYIQQLHMQFPDVHVEQMAFSDSIGTARLKVPKIKGVTYATRGTLEHFSEIGETGAEYIEVPITTLDQYCGDRALSVCALKIDVEGHERAVLAGAHTLLEAQHPILIIEIEQRHHTEPIQGIFDDISALGYDGWFFDIALMRYVLLSGFSVEKNQAMNAFKTPRYTNNFVFLKVGSPSPTL